MLFQLQYPDPILSDQKDFTFWLSPKSKKPKATQEKKMMSQVYLPSSNSENENLFNILLSSNVQ
jgi:hypothetical protein